MSEFVRSIRLFAGIVFALAAIAALGLLAEYARDYWGTPASLQSGLVGYWQFEGSDAVVRDSSGNGNDGIYVNSTSTPGQFGRALQLSGGNDSHASIPATPSLARLTDQISVSAWVNANALPIDYRAIASRQIGTLMHPDQFYLGFGPANGAIRYKWHLGTRENGVVNDRSIYTGTPVAGRWIHLAGVYDGRLMRLFLNGTEIGRQRQSGSIQVDDNPVTIGAEENGAESLVVDGEFDGQIDEVRIYNRALNAPEIRALAALQPQQP